ncbi:MarR family winged helix-turn-helix transcriptional regulator [Leptothoe spongobia]|uniref:MarR family winged helix-turn-helix transcriptional regulator n=1 Tax=Leptothoe spongobia TaxID=2651728 RepID=UPI001C01168F|nr:MarR family transcriptional regulator [Leptothoe spongobia]
MSNNDYLANLLGAFATTVSTRIEDEIAELGGRNLNHEAALVAICNHPNDSIDVLSKVLGISHSGAVRLINTLEKEELVERHRSEDDARAVVLRVTAKGQKRADNVLHAREQITSQMLNSLPTE